ncbi:MAG TPA: response regulator [Clostridia bacterium]|nr:response regulator [Clostridia bacterium]
MMKYVLVVDDQLSIRILLYEVLREAGYHAKCVSNGEECLKIARSFSKPSLILLDYKMPLLNGIEVLSMLKTDSATKDIPVVMITATEDIENEAKRKGASMVLYKPFDLNKLTELLNGTVGLQK